MRDGQNNGIETLSSTAHQAWNPFLGTETAAGYARARPDYHPQAVAALARLLRLSARVLCAVDVGCGTGMSSRALRPLAERVVAVDVSRPMLTAAAPFDGVQFVQAAAERLPVRAACCNLVTSAAAFHWFDQRAMLAEAHRVLQPHGGLAVYTDFFSGHVEGRPELVAWLADVYRTLYPAPPRRKSFDPAAVKGAGFALIGEERLASERQLTGEQLVDYLLTQSNATSAIDRGRIDRPSLRAWLLAEVGRLLPPDEHGVAGFTGHVWCARRSPA